MSGHAGLGNPAPDADGSGAGRHWVQPDLWGNTPTGPLPRGQVYVWNYTEGRFNTYSDDWT